MVIVQPQASEPIVLLDIIEKDSFACDSINASYMSLHTRKRNATLFYGVFVSYVKGDGPEFLQGGVLFFFSLYGLLLKWTNN
jgi:hypothetical protein